MKRTQRILSFATALSLVAAAPLSALAEAPGGNPPSGGPGGGPGGPGGPGGGPGASRTVRMKMLS